MNKQFIFIFCLLLSAVTASASSLDKRSFSKHWRIESESPDARVNFLGDTAEIVAPKGLTLWRNEKMAGNTVIEYDACIMADRPGDRLSDLNCFWMASDPGARDIRSREKWRRGVFLNCYTLSLYYVGFGGNHNSTTRFRRYDGDERGVADPKFRPKILKEYTDSAHLLKPGKWYHIKLVCHDGRVQYYVDGERLVDYLDPEPLRSGYFGFRTTAARARIANFSYTCTPTQPSAMPVHCVGTVPTTARGVRFGVPFERGALKADTPLTLHCADGREIAADTRPLAFWPDGSVKWSAVYATVPAGEKTLSVRIGEGRSKRSKLKNIAQTTPCGIEVATGDSRYFIPREGSAILHSVLCRGVKIASAGRLVGSVQSAPEGVVAEKFVGTLEKTEIEHNGPRHAVVKLTGKHRTGVGREWLPFVVRLYFHADAPEVKMVHTFTFDGEQTADFIRSLGVEFEVPMRRELYNRHVAFSTADGGVWSEPVQPISGRRVLKLPGDTVSTPLAVRQMAGERIAPREKFDSLGRRLLDDWAAWDEFRLSQLSADGFTIRKRAEKGCPYIGTMGGTRAPGVAFAGDTDGGLALYMKDFYESYPSTLEVKGARDSVATLTAWLWSPEAEPMDLRHYDTRAHGLEAAYEDVQEGMSTPYGIARTSTLTICPTVGYEGKGWFADLSRDMQGEAVYLPTPEYLHSRRAFGVWSLPDSSTAVRASVEERLNQYLDYYKKAIETNRWYGFWNYGDVMHAYDHARHGWMYDVGGFAWDNTELGSNLWLWYSFLRTGRADLWRMAEAMTRHVSEVDVYHLGPNATLGSRHNVSHWGCGAKEARISQAPFNRFYYYLTADDRMADLMSAVADSDQKLYEIDPMRLAQPREKYPCTAPARLRIGPDWLAYAGNWMTEWERTGNTRYRDKIVAGMRSICALPSRLFTGPKALGYDPATGVITSECDSTLQCTNHLMTIMGGFEVNNELMELLPDREWRNAWLEHATHYRAKALELSKSKFRVSRLHAYSAWMNRDGESAAEAWRMLFNTSEHAVAPPFKVYRLMPPEVPAPADECSQISTNDAALWSLDAIYMQEVIPQ